MSTSISPAALLSEAIEADRIAEEQRTTATNQVRPFDWPSGVFIRGAIAEAMVRTGCAAQFQEWVDLSLARRATAISDHLPPDAKSRDDAKKRLALRDWSGALAVLDRVEGKIHGTLREAVSIMWDAGDLSGAEAMMRDVTWPNLAEWTESAKAVAISLFQAGRQHAAAELIALIDVAAPAIAPSAKAWAYSRWAIHSAKTCEIGESLRWIREALRQQMFATTPEVNQSILFALTTALSDAGALLGEHGGAVLMEILPLAQTLISSKADGLKPLCELVATVTPKSGAAIANAATFLQQATDIASTWVQRSPLNALDGYLAIARVHLKLQNRDAAANALRAIDAIELPNRRVAAVETITIRTEGSVERAHQIALAPEALLFFTRLGRAAGLWSAMGATSEAEQVIVRIGSEHGRYVARYVQTVIAAELGAFDAAIRTIAILETLNPPTLHPSMSIPGLHDLCIYVSDRDKRLALLARQIGLFAARCGHSEVLENALQLAGKYGSTIDDLGMEQYIPPLAAAGALDAAVKLARGLASPERQSAMLVQIALIIGVPRTDWRNPEMLMI